MEENRISFRRFDRVGLKEQQLWKRGLAFYLDLLFLTLLFIPAIRFALGFFTGSNNVNGYQTDSITESLPLSLAVYFLYFSVLESSGLQASFGKRFLRYKICDRDGEKITFFAAVFRSFFRLISIISVAGIFMIDVNKQRKGLHDIICQTWVKKI